MPESMLMLGRYRFEVATAAYNNLRRSAAFRWAKHEPVGGDPVLQYVGPGGQTIELSGTIYPHYRGGLEQFDRMRDEAQRGEPLSLLNGLGHHLGRWCIERIEETGTLQHKNGAARRIDFSLSLRHVDLGRRHAWDVTT